MVTHKKLKIYKVNDGQTTRDQAKGSGALTMAVIDSNDLI